MTKKIPVNFSGKIKNSIGLVFSILKGEELTKIHEVMPNFPITHSEITLYSKFNDDNGNYIVNENGELICS
jgi:hypothetical protein